MHATLAYNKRHQGHDNILPAHLLSPQLQLFEFHAQPVFQRRPDRHQSRFQYTGVRGKVGELRAEGEDILFILFQPGGLRVITRNLPLKPHHQSQEKAEKR